MKESSVKTKKNHRKILTVLSAVALGFFSMGPATSVAQSDGDVAAGDWPEYHRSWNGWRYSPLTQISKSNVKNLKVAWMHQPGDITQGLQATPITIDGVIYYSGSNNRVFAIDAKTGKEIWHYYAELDPVANRSIFGFYNRGVAVGRGKVYVGSSDGRIIALDQKTGKELWDKKLLVPKDCHGCNFTSPPVLAGSVLIAGPTGGDLAQRGQVFGLDADTGKERWTFDVIKNDPKSWPTQNSKEIGGGGAWLPGQYDPITKLFFIGTSNPAPDFNVANRKGDNLYTSTILAMNPETGKLAWHHQEVPNDAWDFDSPYEFVLLEKNGKKLMVHLNKGGYVTVLDRTNGKVQDVWRFSENINWVDSIDRKTGQLIGRKNPQEGKTEVFCPSALGARSWNAGAYSPQTDLWYTNSYEICNRVKVGVQKVEELAFSQPYYDLKEFEIIAPPGKKATSTLAAYDPMTGKVKWKVDYDIPGLSHVLATKGGLVFNGDSHGWLRAYDDQTGKELWNFNTGSGLRGGITSYMAGGKQYILVAAGFGSLFPGFASSVWPEFKDVRGGATLIAFEVE